MLAGKSRGIQLIESTVPADEMIRIPDIEESSFDFMPPNSLPVVGRVAAGSPILASENVEMHYQVDPDMFRPRADYLLRVQGTSMQDVGILSNDLLAVKQTTDISNGQIVVARIDDEVTVKRFRRIDAYEVHLLPENLDFEPIIVRLDQQQLVIEGRAVGVLRNMMW